MRGALCAAFLSLFFCAGSAYAEPLSLDVNSTDVYRDDFQGRTLAIRLSPDSTEKFGEYTTRRVGCSVDLLVDGQVVITPKVMQPLLEGSFSVSMHGYDVNEVHALARALVKDRAKVTVNDPLDGSRCVGQVP